MDCRNRQEKDFQLDKELGLPTRYAFFIGGPLHGTCCPQELPRHVDYKCDLTGLAKGSLTYHYSSYVFVVRGMRLLCFAESNINIVLASEQLSGWGMRFKVKELPITLAQPNPSPKDYGDLS